MKPQTLLRRLVIAAGVVVVLLAVAFGPQVIAHLTKKTIPPGLATAADASFNVLANATGVLQPGQLENVNFPISGQVQSVVVQVGNKVTARQLLATLNDSTQQAELNAANFAVSAAEAAIAQARATGSPAQVSQAEAQLAQAQVELIRAKDDDAATRLYAPESGTVIQVNGVPGDSVSAGNSGFTNPATNGGSAIANGFIVIGNNSSFEFWAPFSQAEDVLLAPNQTAVVTVDALPGRPFPAIVKSIEPSAIQIGGVPEYYADIALTTSDPRLRSGQTGSVNVTITNVVNVLSVPSTALFTGANGAPQVDVWSGGQAYPTAVTPGRAGTTSSGKALTEITAGLAPGEQVVLSPVGQTFLPTASSPSPS